MRALRWLARWLVRGPDAEHIRTDLDELHVRDLERGRTPGQAARGYARNLAGSAASTWRARPRRTVGASGGGLRLSRLDFTLGLRMLVKHPGLTGLGGLAMAFAIFVGAGAFEFIGQVVSPSLPLPDGDRVVGIRLWDAARSRAESRMLYDLGVWREEIPALRDVGAFRTFERNLATPGGSPEPVTAAAMEAAGFRVAAVPPLLGRWLTEEDERRGAPPVVVIGHDIWSERLGGDPDVIGATVRVGDTPRTIVGVMPDGFAFPVSHEVWVPFDAAPASRAPGEGPGVMVFGRLADGASIDRVARELELVGNRLAAAFPEDRQHLRPQVMPWGRAITGAEFYEVSSLALTVIGLASNLPLLLFLVLICGNVALLMFARAAAREGELLVRSALGASRRRLVLQLFTEALVLAGLAAMLGLAAAQYALGWVFRITETIVLEGEPLPFWFHASLSPSTIVYGALLAVLAAAVAGAVPGLKVTRDLAPRLQHASAGAGGFRFGGIWTAVIVSQIVITMVFPLFSLLTRAQSDLELVTDIDLRSEEYVSAQLRMDPGAATGDDEGASLGPRFAETTGALRDRLLATSGVAGVTFTERLPREYHPWRQIEVDGPAAPAPDERGHRIGSTSVSVGYFDVMEGEILAGRVFRPSDVDGPLAVVVNQTFVDEVLGGRNALGQRVRYVASDEGEERGEEVGPWHEIVGVVEDLGTVNGYGHKGMYHPAGPGEIHPVNVVIHVPGSPRAFMPHLRAAAADLDPALQVHDVLTLDEVTRGQEEFFAFWQTLIAVFSALALLLSVGGIFAVMSFTVARRTREIGIRVALGASKRRVIASVFRKPLTQLGLGLGIGGFLVGGLLFSGVSSTLQAAVLFVAYGSVMAAVFLLACLGPTMRALGVEPSEALRVE